MQTFHPIATGRLDELPTTPPPSRRGRPPMRVRTASAKWIEFLAVFDVLYAPVVGAALTVALARWLALGPLAIALTFVAGTLAAFVFFWLALINCNPYPADLDALAQLEALPNALPFARVDRRTDLEALDYPRVFKPSLCGTNSTGVALVRSAEEARRYLRSSPEELVMAQTFHAGEEFTIMWERWPWRRRGVVRAICWRKKLHAPGEFHPLSGRGTPKVNVAAQHLRTPALVAAVERNVAAMVNVHCTRFDVRAESAEALARGEFWILESNGTVGVPAGSVAYAVLVHWPRRIVIGAYNLFTHADASAHPRVLLHRVRRFLACGGWDFRISDGF